MLKNTIKENRAYLPMDPGVPYQAPNSNLFVYGTAGWGSTEFLQGTTVTNWELGKIMAGYSQIANNFDEGAMLNNYRGISYEGRPIGEGREGTYWDEDETPMADGLRWDDHGNRTAYTMGTLKVPGETIDEQKKYFVQYVLYIMDAPYNNNFNDPVYSYYYDLAMGVFDDPRNAKNTDVLDQLKADFELIGEDRSDTLLVVLLCMNNASAILDEVYANCDVLLLNWGSNAGGSYGNGSNTMFDILYSGPGEFDNFVGRLPVSLYRSNADIVGGDPSVGSLQPEGDWRSAGFGLQMDLQHFSDNKHEWTNRLFAD
jgi:hypothetical protein